MTDTVVPEVYKGLAAILKYMQVSADGTLPNNMGGGKYIKATDLSNEVKKQMVKNNLIILPIEEVKHQEVLVDSRKTIYITVEGEYTIVSVKDGSEVIIQGVGDGLAVGTAVAANMASTNALKNALLRTFLVTEQSVEDQAKDGVAVSGPTKTEQAVQNAKAAGQPKEAPAPKATSEQRSVKDRIRVDYIETGKITRDKVNEFKRQAVEDNPDLKGDDLMNAILEAVVAEVGE